MIYELFSNPLMHFQHSTPFRVVLSVVCCLPTIQSRRGEEENMKKKSKMELNAANDRR